MVALKTTERKKHRNTTADKSKSKRTLSGYSSLACFFCHFSTNLYDGSGAGLAGASLSFFSRLTRISMYSRWKRSPRGTMTESSIRVRDMSVVGTLQASVTEVNAVKDSVSDR